MHIEQEDRRKKKKYATKKYTVAIANIWVGGAPDCLSKFLLVYSNRC